MIERRYDPEVGIVYILSTGTWTYQEIDDHYEKLRALLNEVKASGKRARILSEIASMPRLDPDYYAHLRKLMDDIFQPEDRVAILARHRADRDTLVPFLADRGIALFFSRIPAENWLLHDDLPPPIRRRR